jgi:hypothetical protein
MKARFSRAPQWDQRYADLLVGDIERTFDLIRTEALVPAKGLPGQIVTKNSNRNYDFSWSYMPNQVVTSLPAAGNLGRTVLLTTDLKIYRDNGTTWVKAVDGADVTAGTLPLDNVADGSTYSRVLGTALTSGAIDPSKSGVLSTGSMPQTVPAQSFTYTSTTSSITLSWSAITVYRADGTTITISSGSQAITGLTATTTYKVYPYMVDSGGTTGTVSWATGGSGSPAIAQASAGSAAAAAIMYARGNIPLFAFQASTTTSGGGGGGGGGSGCLHPGMRVALADGTRVFAEDLKAGDLLPTPDGPRPITRISRWHASEWVSLGATSMSSCVMVTPDHIFYTAEGEQIRAKDVRLGALLKTGGDHVEVRWLSLGKRVSSLVSVELDDPHLYYLGESQLLCHNPKP